MNVACPECRSVFRVDPGKIPRTSVRARCSVCGGVLTIDGSADARTEFAPPPSAPAPVVRPSFTAAAAPSPGFGGAEPARQSAAAVATPPAAPQVATAGPARPVAPPIGGSAPARPAMPFMRPPLPVQGSGGAGLAAPFAPRAAAAQPPAAPPPAAAPVRPAAPEAVAPTSVPAQPAASFAPPAVPVSPPAAAPLPPRPAATPASGSPPARPPINPFLANDPNAKAKRLARALVSDIVAYFPGKREEGIRDGTLKQLFREEIKKSYEEYVEQIGREFAETTTHFQDALNDVLAGGKKLF
jgi:predicted Zn finger-like uncharacterized protein